ncbi:hypothetical protein DGWBC_0566 [Dehalogenimonas sp. WBC-2]|nr:hypothetical protein DGWBC_0566 [Dehalogenimonas sp. WBC-2]
MTRYGKWRKTLHVWLALVLLAAASVVSFASLPRPVAAADVTLDTTGDTYIRQLVLGTAMDNNNYGGAVDLRVQSLIDDNQRILLKFAVDSLPAGQVISSATLRLYINTNITLLGRIYGAYRVTSTDWVEGTADGAVETGSASWNSRQDGSLAWASPGGDYTTDDGVTTNVPAGQDVWMEWTVTAQVQYAYDNSIDAHFLIKDSDETLVSAQYIYFNSRESADSDFWPKLEVTYAPVNQPPDIPTLIAPADGASGVSTSPDLVFNYSDPESDSATQFDIQLDNNSDFTSPLIDVTDYSTGGPWDSGGDITYSVGITLSGGTQYFWRVRVYDGANWSGLSDGSWDFTTAATTGSASIEVRDQTYLLAVADITFPAASPGTAVTNPANDHSQTQLFGDAGTAKPVVTLVNTADIAYIVWYNITEFSNGIVTAEYFLVNDQGAACADAAAVTGSVTFGSNQSTGVTIGKATDGAAAQKDLYLTITLSSVALKSGTSTITILGETP